MGDRAMSGTGHAQTWSRFLLAVVATPLRRTITGTHRAAERRSPATRSPHSSLAGSRRASWVTWSANREGAIDRHRVAEQVQHRAMLIDGCRKLLVALGRLRPGDAYLDPDS